MCWLFATTLDSDEAFAMLCKASHAMSNGQPANKGFADCLAHAIARAMLILP